MAQAYSRISIVTPSYNQGEYIEKTILSVLEQKYPNLEYIIIDGGSTDKSVEIIKKYERHLKYWVSEPDRGQSDAINKGFKHATGDLLAWLNSDDYYMPGALHRVASMSLESPETDVFVGAGRILDENGIVVYYRDPPSVVTTQSLYQWTFGGDFMQPSCFFRRGAWEACGPLDTGLHLALDLDLWLNMAKTGFQFTRINELLSTATGHRNAKTCVFKKLSEVECAVVVARHGGDYAVRGILEELARKVSWYEANVEPILNRRLVQLFIRMVKLFKKPAVRWCETAPRWLKNGDNCRV